MLPRAPDLAIILIGLNSSMDPSRADVTLFVVSVHTLMTFAFLSLSLRKPLLY